MTIRTISAEGLRELFAQNSGHALLTLLTITHADLATPLRLVNDRVDLSYGGDTYTALAYEVTLPADTEEEIPRVQLRIDNVGRVLVELLRSISDPATVELTIVRVAPDGTVTPELGPLEFSILDARTTAGEITLQLGYLTDILNEPATSEIMSPSIAPGLFR